jgi:hypothetical protein
LKSEGEKVGAGKKKHRGKQQAAGCWHLKREREREREIQRVGSDECGAGIFECAWAAGCANRTAHTMQTSSGARGPFFSYSISSSSSCPWMLVFGYFSFRLALGGFYRNNVVFLDYRNHHHLRIGVFDSINF